MSSMSFSWNKRLIPAEAQAPQPDHDDHDRHLYSGLPLIMIPPQGGVYWGGTRLQPWRHSKQPLG